MKGEKSYAKLSAQTSAFLGRGAHFVRRDDSSVMHCVAVFLLRHRRAELGSRNSCDAARI